MPQDDQDDFTELFEVQDYTGILQDLRDQIESVNGVKDVSLKTSKHQNPQSQAHNADVQFDITYDPIETSRLQICFDIEEFESVEGQVISA
jgi:hypothetical protein